MSSFHAGSVSLKRLPEVLPTVEDNGITVDKIEMLLLISQHVSRFRTRVKMMLRQGHTKPRPLTFTGEASVNMKYIVTDPKSHGALNCALELRQKGFQTAFGRTQI